MRILIIFFFLLCFFFFNILLHMYRLSRFRISRFNSSRSHEARFNDTLKSKLSVKNVFYRHPIHFVNFVYLLQIYEIFYIITPTRSWHILFLWTMFAMTRISPALKPYAGCSCGSQFAAVASDVSELFVFGTTLPWALGATLFKFVIGVK